MFVHLFKKYGLPTAIRSDNGVPFASNALGRLSELSVWWTRLGIQRELIEPGHPQQNGQSAGSASGISGARSEWLVCPDLSWRFLDRYCLLEEPNYMWC